MKIAYLTADFGVPVMGSKGASVHVRQLVRALHNCGHQVHVLTSNCGAEAVERFDIPTREIPLGDLLGRLQSDLREEELCRGTRLAQDLRNLLYAVALQREAQAFLDDFQPHLLYERYSLFGFAGLELARRNGIPLIVEVNAPLVREQERMRGLSLPTVARTAERMILTGADAVIVVSDELRNYVAAQGVSEDRISVLPNAADPDLFFPRAEPSTVRRRLGWESRFVIGFVGSMKSWHGAHALVEALQILVQADRRFCLLLVGSGPEQSDLERKAEQFGVKDHLHMTGAVPHESVPELIGAMDVAVAPYAADADSYFSPVKLFEYLAMGVPVIAARIGQAAGILEHGRTGWLYTAGDSRELAALVANLADQPELRRRVGAAGREMVLAQFTWRHNARRVIEIAESLVSERAHAVDSRIGAEVA